MRLDKITAHFEKLIAEGASLLRFIKPYRIQYCLLN